MSFYEGSGGSTVTCTVMLMAVPVPLAKMSKRRSAKRQTSSRNCQECQHCKARKEKEER